MTRGEAAGRPAAPCRGDRPCSPPTGAARRGPAFTISAAAAATLLACAACGGESSEAEAIPVIVDQNVMVAPVRLGEGDDTYRFLVDTGADATVIERRLAERLRLSVGPSVEVQSAYGASRLPTARAGMLRIGEVRVGELDVVVRDLAPISEALDADLDGVLGLDVLRRLRFTLDYEAKTIVLWKEASGVERGHKLAVRVSREGYLVPITLNGVVESEFLLDTGSNRSQLSWRLWKRISERQRSAPSLVDGPISAERTDTLFYLTRLGSIRLGESSIDSPVVRIYRGARGGAFADLGDAGVIGGDLLRRFRVHIDLGREIVLLEPNPAYRVDPLEFVTVGIQIARRGGVFVVAAVMPGTPAASAGIEVGDEIVEIDGTAAFGRSGTELQRRLHGPKGSTVSLGLRREGVHLDRVVRREPLL